MENILGNRTNGTWHYEIPPQIYKGSLRLRLFADDIAGNRTYLPGNTGYLNINLEGPEPVKEFPWNIVLIVIVLSITLIATELIFKPGFYRPTGRQRAKALEEEDRRREQEGLEDRD